MTTWTSAGAVVVGVPDAGADSLLPVAVGRAREHDVAIDLVRVWRTVDRLYPAPVTDIEASVHDRELLNSAAGQIRELAPDVTLVVDFAPGDRYTELLDRTRGASALVIGNELVLEESIAAWYLEHAYCPVAVVNQGIGGNGVFGGLGPSATARFQRDVLAISGVKWVILNEGVNDIGGATSTQIADQLITAYQSFITQAHASNLRIYGVPILPFGGSSYESAIHQTARDTVNAWVRTSGAFDAVIDLDAVVRDPQTPTALLPAFDSGDHLHPSVLGHQALGQGVPLTLFVP